MFLKFNSKVFFREVGKDQKNGTYEKMSFEYYTCFSIFPNFFKTKTFSFGGLIPCLLQIFIHENRDKSYFIKVFFFHSPYIFLLILSFLCVRSNKCCVSFNHNKTSCNDFCSNRINDRRFRLSLLHFSFITCFQLCRSHDIAIIVVLVRCTSLFLLANTGILVSFRIVIPEVYSNRAISQ